MPHGAHALERHPVRQDRNPALSACLAASSRPPRRPARRDQAVATSAALSALSAVLLLAAATARAHDAPSGWSYPFNCCSGYDCRAVPTRAVSTGPDGYVIASTGEVVAYSDQRVRHSPDGEYHWCSVAGKDDGRTICLFVPDQVF